METLTTDRLARRWAGARCAVAVLGLVAPTMLAAQPELGPLDGEASFRGVRLGAPLQALAGLVAVETQGPGRVCYERADDDLRFGDGLARSIRYCFERGRLAAILIAADGVGNTTALHEWLEATYGRGRRERGVEGARRIVWEGRQASVYYGEPIGPQSAQARIWLRSLEEAQPRRPETGRRPDFAPPPPRDGAPYAAPGRAAGTLQIGAPRRVRRGLTAQVSVRYRGLAAPGTIRLYLPRELVVQSSVPTAQVIGDQLVWEGLSSTAGNLKFKALIPADTMLGAVLEVYGELLDGAGGRTRARAEMRVQ